MNSELITACMRCPLSIRTIGSFSGHPPKAISL